MAKVIYGYMRISTDKDTQTTDRQRLTLTNYAKENGFEFDKLWEEQISGSINTRNRPVYSEMFRKLGKGDTLVVTDLDRLGRNADNIIMELKNLKEYGVKVVALDTPYLDNWDRNQNDDMNNMVIDIVVTIKAHMAEQEKKKISERVRQGMAAAKENPDPDKKPIGRPSSEESKFYNEVFKPKYKKFREGKYGETTKTDFARDTLKIGRTTLYKYIDIYEEELKREMAKAKGEEYKPTEKLTAFEAVQIENIVNTVREYTDNNTK